MRKFLLLFGAFLLMISGSATAVAAQDDATPSAGGGAESSDDVNPVNPELGDEVTYFATNGDAIGTIAVTDVERNWEGYDEYQEPEAGTEFIAVTVSVESTISRGALEVSPYRFSLQDGQSFLLSTAYAKNEDSGDELQVLSDDLTLAGGEKAEFLLIFQVYIDQPLQHVYWSPENALLTLADLSEI